MLYTLLGRIVWRLAKRRLKSHRRTGLGSRRPGSRSLAGTGLAVVVGLGVLLARRSKSARP